MRGGQTQMDGIIGHTRRNDGLGEQPLREHGCLRRAAQNLDPPKRRQTRCGKFSVPTTDFKQHSLRDKEIERLPSLLPPFLCGFLISRELQIAAASGNKITGYRRFKVKPWVQFSCRYLRLLRVCACAAAACSTGLE